LGLTLFEPFGGICSGLEAALRAGLPIRRYIYCDTSTAACLIAKHRVAQLMAYYPSLLKAEAVADAFTTLPQDVYSIRPAELAALAREHNDANVLALGARIIGIEMAKACVTAFLTTPFGGDRHARRVAKLGKAPV
jgi:hypothetical protein